MDKLGAFVERRRWLVLGFWLVLLVAALPFAARQTEHLTAGGFVVPGSSSESVERSIDRFEGAERQSLAVVLARRPGSTPADLRAQVDRVDRIAAKRPHAELTDRAAAVAKRQAAKDGVVVVPLTLDGHPNEIADLAVDLRHDLGPDAVDGVQPYLVGQTALWAGMQDLSKADLETAEATGFPIVLLILLGVFGSFAAATLPLLLGFVSVMVTGAVIFFVSQATDMSVFVTNVASMVGIGVAVDYSLFVLARYREEVRAGVDPVTARRTSLRTSGIAVVFSGVTVIVSMGGLFLVHSTTIRSMALGAIVVVAVSILAAVTLLPVLMRLFGRRVYERGRIAHAGVAVARRLPRRRRSPAEAAARPDFWQRWTNLVMRRHWLAAAGSAGILLVLAIPALSLQFGDGALRQFPDSDPTVVGAKLAAQKEGAGTSAPTQVVAELDRGTATSPANRAALAAYVREARQDPEVGTVVGPQASRDGRAALITVAPRHDAESPQARELIGRLQDGSSSLERVAHVEVGGATAFNEDFKNLVSGSMWKILLFVMAFSYLVLFVLLRSVLLPLKAVLMNLLSVGAAYGVLVAVFQWGWIDGFLGFHSLGYINTMTPPLLLAIVFGLSMDYEVFLLSRIRERYDATGDTSTAVAQGLRASAVTISSAALIMVAVFAVFAGTGVPSIKEIGLGLAVAIALDATLVRLVLVPAAMRMMGRWNWWLPRPLARVLPRASFDTPSTRTEHAPA